MKDHRVEVVEEPVADKSLIWKRFCSVWQALLCVLVAVLPMKFALLLCARGGEQVPDSIWGWYAGHWPVQLLPVITGVLLLGSVIFTWDREKPVSDACQIVLCVLALLVLAMLPGLVRTTNWHYAVRYLTMMAGVWCLAASVALWLQFRPSFRNALLIAVALGALFASFRSWEQTQFGGYKQTLSYLEEMKAQGSYVNPKIENRLRQGRATAMFANPNSLAGYLVLVLPTVLLILWKVSAKLSMPRVLQGVLLVLGGVCVGGALWFTGSRAAVLALGAAAVLTLLSMPLRQKRYVKPTVVVLAFVAVAGFFITVNQERRGSTHSIDARFTYWKNAVEMVVEKPLIGVGLGEFGFHYTRLKGGDAETAEETWFPHNVILLFATNAGLVGVLLILPFLLLPFFLLFVMRGERKEKLSQSFLSYALVTGLIAWVIHSMADFNLQIPASIATWSVMTVLLAQDLSPSRLLPLSLPVTYLKGIACLFLLLAFATGLLLPGIWAHDRLLWLVSQSDATPGQVMEQGKRAAAYDPFSPYSHIVLSQAVQNRAGQEYELALSSLVKACDRMPHWSILWFDVAHLAIVQGKIGIAKQALEQGRYWYPESERVSDLKALLSKQTDAEEP